MKYLSASILYNFIQCPHKVWRDIYGPQDEKDPEPNPFVELLWERGVLHEKKVIESIGQFIDLSQGTYQKRFKDTLDEMKKGTELIYQGVIIYNNYLGIPDLLRRVDNDKYIPIDIKSGRGFENITDDTTDDEKYKKHYAVQLCHYVEILKNLGYTDLDEGKIIDIHNKEVTYNLNNPIGIKNKSTWWEYYFEIRNQVESLMQNKIQNKPAMAGVCKLCQWYKSCKKWAKDNNDPTTIFYVGRSKRDTLYEDLDIQKVNEIINIDIPQILLKKSQDKNYLKGIGEKTIKKIVQRAIILQKNTGPVIYKKIEFPKKKYELYFDIEDDPTQEIVYLHGVYQKTDSKDEKFIYFVSNDITQDAEKQAWKEFWQYIKSLPQDDFVVYYYSSHEKTVYTKMQQQYPDIISADELQNFFNKKTAIDLYTQIIYPYTDWPLGSYSVKDIAQYLGFKWRDKTPSGALSIQWYNEYLKDKDPKKLQRILDYNEDDCKATMVIKESLEGE